MESLYVCLFSNGHIKVGRSVDPKSRIAQHAERVSCMGIELRDHYTAECVGPASEREQALINRCAEHAEQRFHNEWFVGLQFWEVRDWARNAAELIFDPTTRVNTFGARLRKARTASKLSQTELGKGMASDGGDLLKAAISSWETDRCSPNVQQLRLICERLGVSADSLLGISIPHPQG